MFRNANSRATAGSNVSRKFPTLGKEDADIWCSPSCASARPGTSRYSRIRELGSVPHRISVGAPQFIRAPPLPSTLVLGSVAVNL